jgi:hypothetical protein
MKYKGKRMNYERYRQLKKAKENRLSKLPITPVSKNLYDLLLHIQEGDKND